MKLQGQLAAFAALAVLGGLAGCGGTSGGGGGISVVASFYPLAWVAQGVVRSHADVTSLTSVGQEPHDLELSVSQLADLAGADVVLYERGFQPGVDEGVRTADLRGAAVDVTRYVGLTADDPGPRAQRDPAAPPDPHFWLDPTLVSRVVTGFVGAMGKADPAHAAAYRRNGALLRARLARLDRDYRTGLSRCRTRTVVVSHDAFGYLGRRYHLDIVPIAGLSPDAEPSARQLATIRAQAQRAGVTTVFSETLASPALAETLADELGVRTAVLDPLEGLARGAHGDYLSLMRDNLTALRKAGGCR